VLDQSRQRSPGEIWRDEKPPGAAAKVPGTVWRMGKNRVGPLPRPFQILWAATALSNIGDGLRLTALPLLATSVTTDPRAIAGVAVAERIPWLVLILPGGAWADRHDRRKLRLRLDLARGAVMTGLVALIVMHRLSMAVIYVVAALVASAEAVVDSSSMALVPATVGEADLERAGSRLASTEILTNELIGPPLGGLLFSAAVALPFGIDAFSFLSAAATMSMMRGNFATEVEERSDEPMVRQIADGFRWFWKRPALRNLALIGTVLGTASFISSSVFVLFATQTLGLSPAGYGLLLVPGGFAGIAGSLVAPKLARYPLRLVLGTVITAEGVMTLVMSRMSSPILVAVIGAAGALIGVTWNVLTVAFRQRVIPNHLLGRVGASFRFLVYVGMPFGALAGGFLAKSFGVRAALAANGVIFLTIGLATPFLLRGITNGNEAGQG
jgi:predicted MFS family arabinose efflux permease